jgi:hypothetical protein
VADINRAVGVAVRNAERRDTATLSAVADIFNEGKVRRYAGPVLILLGVFVGTVANIAAL